MIKTIILITLTIFCIDINAKNYSTPTDYFIAKNLFNKKEYAKSEFFLKKIIAENNLNNKYVIKAKILKAFIEYKKKDLDNAQNTLKTIEKSYNNFKYYNKISYLKSIIYYNINDNYIQKILGINKDKKDQTMQYKALSLSQKIKNDKNFTNKIKKNIKIIKKEIDQNKINICLFYIKQKAYIAVINRLENKNFDLKIKKITDYNTFFLILKSYNELLLDKISEKILNKIKKYDKIQTSSN
jgi:outer membrane protein assembly factor BamD (BamD/ComL family)